MWQTVTVIYCKVPLQQTCSWSVTLNSTLTLHYTTLGTQPNGNGTSSSPGKWFGNSETSAKHIDHATYLGQHSSTVVITTSFVDNCRQLIRRQWSTSTIIHRWVHQITGTWHNTHTHTVLFPGLPRWAGTRKVKPIWFLLKQETVCGSGISWAICKSTSRSRQITTRAPNHSVFYRPDALPSTQPTASKHWRQRYMTQIIWQCWLMTDIKQTSR